MQWGNLLKETTSNSNSSMPPAPGWLHRKMLRTILAYTRFYATRLCRFYTRPKWFIIMAQYNCRTFSPVCVKYLAGFCEYIGSLFWYGLSNCLICSRYSTQRSTLAFVSNWKHEIAYQFTRLFNQNNSPLLNVINS